MSRLAPREDPEAEDSVALLESSWASSSRTSIGAGTERGVTAPGRGRAVKTNRTRATPCSSSEGTRVTQNRGLRRIEGVWPPADTLSSGPAKFGPVPVMAVSNRAKKGPISWETVCRCLGADLILSMLKSLLAHPAVGLSVLGLAAMLPFLGCDPGTSVEAAGGSVSALQGGSSNPSGGGPSVLGGAAGALTNPDCSDTATLNRSFTSAYDSALVPVENSTKTYYFQSNWWYQFNGDESIDLDGLRFRVNNPSEDSVGPTVGMPKGYPSLFIGSYAGNQTAESNLPIKVSDITSVPTVFSTNSIPLGMTDYNAAYDVWFTDTSSPLGPSDYSPPPGGAYLMVWLFKPTNRQPRGSNQHPDHTVEGVDGTWNVWVDPSSPPCISYVSSEPLDALSFDLNDFIKDSVTNGYGITDSMYLSIVFAGFEIWGGADGLTGSFCASVN